MPPAKWVIAALLLLTLCFTGAGHGQRKGSAALDAFREWKEQEANAALKWEEALDRYRDKLAADGLNGREVETTLRLVVAYDEAVLYNRVYAGTPGFNTEPNGFLVRAVEDLPPGSALDVGMGQGRNAIYLARRGWNVTGFDVAEVGLRKAREQAENQGLSIETVHASDEEFDFGESRWDLIVIIHTLEKRSVNKVSRALKPGGVVVMEQSHIEPDGYPFGYESNELLGIFRDFRILRYEDTSDVHDFSEDRNKKWRQVRLVARKPR